MIGAKEFVRGWVEEYNFWDRLGIDLYRVPLIPKHNSKITKLDFAGETFKQKFNVKLDSTWLKLDKQIKYAKKSNKNKCCPKAS